MIKRKLIQPQHCLLLIVYVYSLGTSASWPNIVSRIPKYISSTSALFAIGLPYSRGASLRSTQKPGAFYNRQENPCAVINKQSFVAGRHSRNSQGYCDKDPRGQDSVNPQDRDPNLAEAGSDQA